MAQLDKDLYVKIAKSLVDCETSLAGSADCLLDALNAVVDITTTNYPEDSSDDDGASALEVTLALLDPLNSSYQGIRDISKSKSPINRAVVAVNNFVIRKSSSVSLSPSDRLSEYIDSIEIAGDWTEELKSDWIDLCDGAKLFS